jgi:Beta-galactosidase
MGTAKKTKKKTKKKAGLPARAFKATRRRVAGWNRWQRFLTYTLVVLSFLMFLNWFVDQLWAEVKDPRYGASFSIKYAEELGNDWRANYSATLDDLEFKHLRLMSYWDTIEPERGQYTFENLDWQMDQAAAHNAKVSLVLGLRQPRWPECHEPAFAKTEEIESTQWRASLYSYIGKVVERYRNHPALDSYQLENEAVNSWFGDCRGGAAKKDRLNEEFNLVKKLDPNHRVLMSLSDQTGLPLGTPVPDAYGYSVYRIVWNDKTPVKFYITYPTPLWYHKLRTWWIKQFKDRDVFVHELQMEPWGPKATKELSVEEQDKSMGPAQIHKNFSFGRKVGKQEIYVWGTEWWYWRKTHFNDPGPWNAVKEELTSVKTSDN